MEFGRRLAIEKELAERSPESARRETAAWDETGNFILYPSLVGIKGTTRIACSLAPSQLLTYPLSKVINTITNRLVRILGRDENHRFLNISLYQGAPIKKGLQTIVSRSPDYICFLALMFKMINDRPWQHPKTRYSIKLKLAILPYSALPSSAPDSTCSHKLSRKGVFPPCHAQLQTLRWSPFAQ